MKLLKIVFCIGLVFLTNNVTAQDSLDVTFRYTATENTLRAFVPGEFNNWGNNTNGRIPTDDGSLMIKDQQQGYWYKTIRLEVGGGGATHEGASGYAYKFHEQYNSSGSDWQWFSDSLNPITVGNLGDSFVEVTHPFIAQMQPKMNGFHQDSLPQLWATVSAKDEDPIQSTESRIYINDEQVASFENFYDAERKLLHIESPADLNIDLNYGSNEFKIVAVTEAGAIRTDSTQFSYIAAPDVVEQSRPEGLRDGITYSTENDSTVFFSLFAPAKEFVYLTGDFTDWTVQPEFLMKRDSVNADSVWYWIEINGLTPGQEYAFQYFVNGELKIADPYSELILDPYNDEFIPGEVYPQLKDYPEGSTEEIAGIIQPGKQEYEWQAANYQRPAKENLVIYELLIRDFVEDHNYHSLIDTLDYLDKLGINAIELMPVNEFDGNESWGYNPSFHLALDKYYGTRQAFKEFVDEAHKRDIAVILDVVLNHATGQNPLYRLYEINNPYFNKNPRHAYNVFNDFNHQYAGTQYYVKRVIEHWVNEYKIDGFRWDLTKGFTQNCSEGDGGCTGAYQQDRVDVLKQYADYQWAADPDFIVIFEHLGTEDEEKEWVNYRLNEGKGVMVWGNMNYQYNEATMGYDSNLYGVLSESRSSFNARHLVGYMESHDEQWLMFKNRNFGNSSGNYDITELNTALNRQKLAGAFFFTLPGPRMIWQFGELGYGGGPGECLKPGGGDSGDCSASDPGRVSPKPIRWDYYNNPDTPERLKLYKTWSALIQLRLSSPVFTDPESESYSLSGSVKTVTLEHEDSDVVIAGNFGVNAVTFEAEFTTTGTWYDFFTGTPIDVTQTEEEIYLEPGKFKIYTSREFETPEQDIVTSKEQETADGVPAEFSLSQNYPNPFNPSTTFSYEIPSATHVVLEIFDVTGRQVAELVNKRKTAGIYTVRYNASHLGSGVYIYRLRAGEKVMSRKMILIK
ncbi:MAG: T9SS type A sorting domain-containing protein [Balneolaceae bacterium]|nr:T9SS type A sorting domain-containing protein [Balneolaceae bacterium]